VKTIIIALVVLLFAGCVQTQQPSQKTQIKKDIVKDDKTIQKIKKESKSDLKYSEFKKISKAKMVKISFDEIIGFNEDDHKEALEVFIKDCKASKRKLLLKDVCKKALETNDPKEFFSENFYAYKLLNKDFSSKGLITGYYEPILQGSLEKSEKYPYAVYKTPSNLITVDTSEFPQLKGMKIRGKVEGNKLVRYPSRKEINKLDNLEPICYVDNKIDLFFMHIQGSGKVQLEDQTIINLNYDSQNGRGYYAIGKELIKRKAIRRSEVSLQTIKQWLEEHPNEVDDILNLNKSYIFFKKSNKSATGALGIELVEKRNIAVDRRYIPLGIPVFLQTKNPISKEDMNILTVAADVGGAIKGKIRADYYFGSGKEAGMLAGKMKNKGTLIVFLPKGYIDAYDE
jgi:membrane-bound lytic murein transglycosylase A